MPNHVHAILTPRTPLSDLMQWLKAATARRGNRLLDRTGLPFWQDESFDHWVRSEEELEDLVRYVERNPVQAGLVGAERDWLWSSARSRS